MLRRLRIVIPAALLLALIGTRMADPPFLASIRAQVFDQYQYFKPRDYKPSPVRVIDIDDETLARFGQWPWPRTLVAKLIIELSKLGAAVIAFDFVFAEPDRTSPAQVIPLWGNSPAVAKLKAEIESLPDHDRFMARIIKKSRVVTAFALLPWEGGGTPAIKAGFATAGDDPRLFLPTYRGAATSLQMFEEAALGNGSFSVAPERDGVIRRLPLLLKLDDKLYPSLGAEALRVAQNATTYVVSSSGAHGVESFGQETGISSIKVGSFPVLTDRGGRVWLYDSGRVADRVVPAWKVLEGKAPPDLILGSILFVGSSAAGLQDIRKSPLQSVVAGVQLHAQLIEQVINNDYLIRPELAGGVEVVFLALVSGILVLLMRRLGAIRCAVLGLFMVAVAVGLSWYAFASLKLLFDPVYPSLAAGLVYVSASFLGYISTELDKRRIRHAFSHYMAPEMVDRLAAHPEQLKLGGEMREITVLFCDIRNFTGISERLEAQSLTGLINRFLTPMTDSVMSRRGTIDKYIGDCIMAFWNAPLDDPQHGIHACQAALSMRERLVTLNAELSSEGGALAEVAPLRFGIGLNSGVCTVGNLGSMQRFDYSVLGDTVNVTSRIEGLTKSFGVDIIIGERTRELSTEFTTIELDLVRVRGKTAPARIYALLGDGTLRADESMKLLLAAHADMIAAYRRREWRAARQHLTACRLYDTAERFVKLYRLYEDRLAEFEHSPPPEDWDGVIEGAADHGAAMGRIREAPATTPSATAAQ
jgi:adenylate cyclase